MPQATPEGYVNSYWTLAIRLDTNKVTWKDFRNKFKELGGHGIYSAWMLGYLEPMYRNQAFMGREKIIARYGDYKYSRGLCPVAEDLQPRLLQFKTNYWDEADAIEQAIILKKTAQFFD